MRAIKGGKSPAKLRHVARFNQKARKIIYGLQRGFLLIVTTDKKKSNTMSDKKPVRTGGDKRSVGNTCEQAAIGSLVEKMSRVFFLPNHSAIRANNNVNNFSSCLC